MKPAPPTVVATYEGSRELAELGVPLPLDRLVSGGGPWEVEIGFGKGRFLLARALARPSGRFLGIEIAGKYHSILVARARKRRLSNLAAIKGDALYLLSVALPRGFAAAVHVYFPDPWPKSRHHKRRLFDPETVDLVAGLLSPAGRLYFATDFVAYGEVVEALLTSHPDLEVERREGPWEGGARTNYEAKYVDEGRPILRLVARLRDGSAAVGLHPCGETAVTAAWARPPEA